MLARFRHVWATDFEFVAHPGSRPRVVCLVARDLHSGHTLRLWEPQECPFRCDDSELFVSYYASAEASCFNALGWPRPRHMLDLFAEFRCLTNGVGNAHGNGLIGAMLHFGLLTIGADEKHDMRDLVLRGPPWTDEERVAILDYCQSDVDALERLMPAIMRTIDFQRALLRGRYMTAAGTVENIGTPIDVDLLGRLRQHWTSIKVRLIEAIDAEYGIYTNGRFTLARFDQYLALKGIPWPRLPSGQLALDDDTFRQQSKAHPEIGPIKDLRHTLSQLRLNDLAVGPDGRNRVMLSAFRSITGRNQPSSSRSIFGPSSWLRSLIKPTEGRALAYVDWSSQEIAIAGALSGDEQLWAAYQSGDPYLAFAIAAGMAPANATKATYARAREICKIIVLGTNYGMTAEGIAERAGVPVETARDLLQKHRASYRVFWAWVEAHVDRALLGLGLRSAFGWRLCYPPNCGKEVNVRSILNWPMQSNGAEMMRLAVIMTVEAGLQLCAPIHDAMLLEAPADEIGRQVGQLVEIMGRASEMVLGPGKRCRCDVKIIRYPDRYRDPRGAVMFATVLKLLAGAESRTPDFREPEGRPRAEPEGWLRAESEAAESGVGGG